MTITTNCNRCGRVSELTNTGICADCSRSTDAHTSETRFAEPANITNTFNGLNLSAAVTGTFTNQSVVEEMSAPIGGVAEIESRRDLEEIRYLAEKGYQVERKLGRGGFGTVWLATDSTDRWVAVKVLHRYVASGLSQDRFTAEAKVLAALKHEGLIELYHFDRLNADPFLVTEYVPGGTLAEKLRREGPMPPKAAAAFISRVAEIVQYLHENKVIHRDLKPSNILLNAAGLPKLGDFGLAKWEGKETLTPSGQMVGGTPEYGAPEQFRGNTPVDARTDVYALGATLYCTLIGRPPFQRMPDSDLVKEIDRLLNTPIPPLTALNPTVTDELEAVCLKAMAKNPRDRYQTAQELASELGRIARGEPTVTRPPTWVQRIWRRAERNWKVLTALAAVFVVGVITAAVWPPDPLKPQQAILSTGKQYIAIPERGFPAYHRWLLGDQALLTSSIGDGTCSFQSLDIDYLMLVQDTMTDNYDFQADVRQETSVDTRQAGVGLFLAYHAEAPAGKTPAFSMIRLEYTESPHASAPDGPPSRTVFQFSRIVGFRLPNGEVPQAPYGFGNKPFKGAARSPGPWRTIRVEVRANSIRVFWGTDPNQLEMVKSWTPDELSKVMRQHNQGLTEQWGDLSHVETIWNPRRSLGVWAAGSVASFRNVVITPISIP